ncbi:MAG TPA: YlxM family DNA-binding protein [Syntrophomonadaceae bacterium]|nr:YlxM family DNA-binding protein [Syntrophomonadaceae bacterium]
MPEKTANMVILKDFYGPLLTKKQQHVLNLYYENDWSLSEIGESLNVTRQAIFDLLKRSENSLISYEKKLGLVRKFVNTSEKLEEIYMLLNSEEESNEPYISNALKILREIIEEV